MSNVYVPVSEKEALTVPCPRCLALQAKPCTYLADKLQSVRRKGSGWYKPRVLVHAQGDPITGTVHAERREVIRHRQKLAWRRGQLDRRPVMPASRQAREAAAAMRAWDLAEYKAMRNWLREYGWLLTEANLPRRPDGTLRGDTYALGDYGG